MTSLRAFYNLSTYFQGHPFYISKSFTPTRSHPLKVVSVRGYICSSHTSRSVGKSRSHFKVNRKLKVTLQVTRKLKLTLQG
ncbi:unnamed protein product [Acanthoscelides obtectus]|uniref:Uncharacterized protein n=1 Tax=Acanthoscelides obtectus TaxID=200917 RepID=A0A9P0QGN5_ACAOB|nr:unnamed protein product [Acanthoscelides obtectus]CAK1682461.1 hypothetical protein AOBTE_LOCUS33646 [Acanthoscelides obtectus]